MHAKNVFPRLQAALLDRLIVPYPAKKVHLQLYSFKKIAVPSLPYNADYAAATSQSRFARPFMHVPANLSTLGRLYRKHPANARSLGTVCRFLTTKIKSGRFPSIPFLESHIVRCFHKWDDRQRRL